MRKPWSFGEVFVLRHAGFPFDWLEELGVSEATRHAVDALLVDERDGGKCAAAEAAYEADRAELRRRLHARACDEGIQEAVFLSSPDVFENVWSRYVEGGPPSEDADGRRTERTVYAYLQRLCAKNETTSFFGPMGYGAIAGDDDAIEFVAADPSRRRTTVAYWAAEALAAAIAAEPSLFRALPMRQSPLFRVDFAACTARCDALGRHEALSPDEVLLLQALQGACDAPVLAKALDREVEWVEAVAMKLFGRGVLLRRLWFPSDAADPLAALREAVEQLPVVPTRTRWLADLDHLDALRAKFGVAPLGRRRQLLGEIEALFTELTGMPARRAGGRLYTDRLVLNEEASSPVRLRIGAAAAQRLLGAISPMLDRCALQGDALQCDAAQRITAEAGDGPRQWSLLGYAARFRHLAPCGAPPTRIEVPPHTRVAALPETVGVPAGPARFALPDVSLGRRPDGTFHPVLSSMHHHLLTRGWLFAFHPDPARVRMAERWIDASPVPLVELATGRHNKGYYSFPGARAAHAAAELVGSAAPILPASEWNVTLDDGRPTLRAPDGTACLLYLPLADLTLHAPFTALASPPVVFAPLRAPGAHTPRFDVEGATYQRERWTLPVDGWKSLRGFALFVAVQRARRTLGLPRFTFARVPGERKPFLVDADSPFAVELLKHMARDAKDIVLEEMLPSPDQLWLRDARGRYTFEIRIQAERR